MLVFILKNLLVTLIVKCVEVAWDIATIDLPLVQKRCWENRHKTIKLIGKNKKWFDSERHKKKKLKRKLIGKKWCNRKFEPLGYTSTEVQFVLYHLSSSLKQTNQLKLPLEKAHLASLNEEL